jgi:hypothetical protein
VKFNVGIKGKGYCFVELQDMTYDEYMSGALAHEKVMDAIAKKYGTKSIIGYAPVKDDANKV